MIGFPFPGIGVVFDIDRLGGGFYGREAWLAFMKTMSAKDLPTCILVDGDTIATLSHGRREYCIGVYGSDEIVELIRDRFSDSDHHGLADFHRRFAEKLALDEQPLPIKGHVDTVGRLITKRWDGTEHRLCLETGWGYLPDHVPDDLGDELSTQLDQLRRPQLPW